MKLILFTLRGLKVKVSGLRVKFVHVCELFDGYDRLKIIIKSLKNKITKLYFIFKIFKNYLYISSIYRRNNMKLYQ